jgi:CPA2 family monovalent cation:H+ antiporter-2
MPAGILPSVDLTARPILELGLVLLAAAALGWAARRIGLPAVVGYLALGVAVSPFTPGFVADREQIQLLADVGVVLLLFEVGIEVDLARIRREQRGLLVAAPLQVLLTTAIAGGAALAAGVAPLAAAVVGLCIALSSSVVIVNITRSRRRTTDPATEDALLGWSVVQDVTGVVLAALLLAAVGANGQPVETTIVGLVLFAGVAVATARLLPVVLGGVREQHDTFLIVSVASGLAIAGIGSVVFHVPLALAAFVGGLAITEGGIASEVRRRLLPFRDVLAVLFFVAIGMLFDPSQVGAGLPWIVGFLALIAVAKVGVAYPLARFLMRAGRPLQLSVGLGQIGEFSFVLASALVAAGAIPDHVYVAMVAVVAISIAVSTIAVRLVGSRPTEAAPA